MTPRDRIVDGRHCPRGCGAVLAIGRPGYRLGALVGALASVPVGLVVAAGQIAMLLVVLAVPLSIEGYRQVKATGVRAVVWRR